MTRFLLALPLLTLCVTAAAQPVAIVNARVMTMTSSGTVDAATVVLEGGRIVAVGPNVRVPANARVIDAHGRTVTPGLFNGFTRLGLVEVNSADETSDHAATGGRLGAGLDVRWSINPNSTLIALARADGLVRACVAPSVSPELPFAGTAATIRLREGAELVDPEVAGVVATIGGASANQAGGSRSVQWQTLREALQVAASSAPQGTDGVSWWARRASPADQAALRGLVTRATPLLIEVDRESDIRHAVSIGEEFGVRVVVVGGAEAWRVADLLASRHVPVIVDPFLNQPESFDKIGARIDNAVLLERAGVTVAFYAPGMHMSHDAGLAIREGAGVAASTGLSREAALRAITLNPARIFGLVDRTGSIEPGRDADVVIWDGDPLEMTSSPDLVFIEGREVSRATRQQALRDRYHPKRAKDPMPATYR
jgi:imidazolonepropionase-like amidohydrolase